MVMIMSERKQETTKVCEWCGVRMTRKRTGGRLEDLSVFNRRKFCSLTCANSRKHPRNWTTYHLRAQKHRGDHCEACGQTTSLVAHHVDQDITNNEADNIQTLCKPCHDFWHSTAKRRGRMVAGRMVCLGLSMVQ
jgi:hypothetical protein